MEFKRKVNLNKKSMKYLASVDVPTRNKINTALNRTRNLSGNITKLKNTQKQYDYTMFEMKIENYRIIFYYDKNNIYVEHLLPKNNTKFRRCGVHN